MPDWDAKYAAEASPFGDAPNEYVRRIATRADFQSRSALCLADGDGRNGAWLAARGLAVTAVDISDVATEKARARDAAAGVAVERIAADLAIWSPPERTWEAVFLIYLQTDPQTRDRVLRLAVEALAPGGWLVIEGFARVDGMTAEAGPKDPAVAYSLGEVMAALDGLDILEALEGLIRLDEGPRHQGPGTVIRVAARKPG